MKRTLLFILTLAVILAGCESEQAAAATEPEDPSNEQPSTETPEPDQTAEAPANDPVQIQEPEVHLELCYATSVNFPETAWGPENVFDDDTATVWSTMPGAGPDEGIYFSFKEPVEIHSLEVTAATGENWDDLESFQLFVNGIEGAPWSEPGEALSIDTKVKTIFVRIDDTGQTEWVETGVSKTGDLPVAVSEIILTVENEEGEPVRLSVIPVNSEPGSVLASSSLQPEEAYSTRFLFDSRPGFGWADGNTERTGVDETLTFTFEEPVTINRLKIWNGYHRSQNHFLHNERAESFSFGIPGEAPGVYDLRDTMIPQVIELEEPLQGTVFQMKILNVFPGDAYRDLVISEMRFGNESEWFTCSSNRAEEVREEIISWAEGNSARHFLDRQLCLRTSDPDGYDWYGQTLAIRSNGSFVLWIDHEFEGGEETFYADGNWQILSNSQIRIFGRRQSVGHYDYSSYDPYAGARPDQNQQTEAMAIFSDTISFGSGWLESSRGLFEAFSFLE